jgi:hypothetical protein
MPVDPRTRSLVAVATVLRDLGAGADEIPDPLARCGRCRLTFARHPSIGPGSPGQWRLCPPCRSRLRNEGATRTHAPAGGRLGRRPVLTADGGVNRARVFARPDLLP